MKIKIVPTILTDNFVEFKQRLNFLEKYFSLIQIDCADGKFVKNKTFYNKSKIQNLKSKVSFELHLMTQNPSNEIEKWADYKNIKRIIFHYEAVKVNQINEIIEYLHKKGIKAGLAINPATKLEKIAEFLPQIDLLLILGVKPGWGGQKIQIEVVKSKVHKVRTLFPNLDIEVDGGVNLGNVSQIIAAGANILAMGYYLNSEENIKKISAAIKK